MIDYSPFWDTLKNSNELITKYNISRNTKLSGVHKKSATRNRATDSEHLILDIYLVYLRGIISNRLLFYNPIY